MQMLDSKEVPVQHDCTNVDCLPKNASETIAFSSLIDEELSVRNMPVTGSLKERQKYLRLELVAERAAVGLQQLLLHAGGTSNKSHLMSSDTPCMLHSENRVGLI